MAKGLTAGDTVRIAQREQTAADVKSSMYYPHFAGLAGVVGKVYPDNTASVTVDVESLPKAVRERHQASTQSLRQKWLDGLSDEARNRLSSAEKKLTLRYAILVSVDDLISEKRAAVAAAPAKPAPQVSSGEPVEPVRKTLEDIEAEEARYLAEVARRKQAETDGTA